MRKPWNHQPSGPPLPLLIFCIVGILALIVVLGKSSSSASQSGVSNPVADVYRNYRRMREEVADDLFDIMSLSMRTTQTVELDFCGKEREHYVPCHNVSANRLAGFGDGEEFDRHCEVSGVGPRCLVRPPKDYKIPMKWPLGGDIIWSGNLKLTKDQFLASGSITKRQFFKIMGIFSFMNVLMCWQACKLVELPYADVGMPSSSAELIINSCSSSSPINNSYLIFLFPSWHSLG